MKTGFVYIWYDTKRKMYYIGCRYGTINDGYICSSNRMRDAYRRRPNDFKRRILKSNIERDKLLEEEFKWLSLIKENELGEKYYNLHKHHFGHWSNDSNKVLTSKEKIKIARSKQIITEEHKKNISLGLQKFAQTELGKKKIKLRAIKNTGKKRTLETKTKISNALKGQTRNPLKEETKEKLRQRMLGEKNPFYGKTHIPEIIERIKNKNKGKKKPPRSLEHRMKISEHKKSYWKNWREERLSGNK